MQQARILGVNHTYLCAWHLQRGDDCRLDRACLDRGETCVSTDEEVLQTAMQRRA